ncbi:nudC domain-containing protein 1 [Plodia interpunctella]|uniref:nudC domain-containing protein 1 n=1 Tax=Plodia interpunctella TaxID=58824 RepID=UPI002368C0B3|nr:nudC domain-containing protein 1 [Plodia interpunctella]
MSSSLVELRPNRRLLDHEFEGYKLNLQALPHYAFELESPVDRVFPDEVQYSFIHAKLFALHNHLVLDYWDYSFNYYYIDIKQQVRYVTFENTNHKFQNSVVYDIPAHVERKSGHFNLCLTFSSSNLAVVSDGTGYLHIIDTGPRNRSCCRMWQTLHSSLVLGEGKYFVVLDSRLQEMNEREVLHCLIQSVEQNDKHFNTVLTWVTFETHNQTWKQTSLKQLQGKGIVHYAAIETNCSALYVASDNIFKFTSDSEKEIAEPPKEEPRKIIYTWLQTTEDITITLRLQENFDKKLFHVTVTPLNIKVCYAGNTFVDGKLRHKVDSEFTTWNVQESGQVDILITKTESMLWNELLEGGDGNGEQILDASLVEEAHQRLAHLCSETVVTTDEAMPSVSTQELEECDAVSEEDTVLVRLDTSNHQITHRIPLSIHQFLFSIKIETQEASALALRHDVDACIWQPYAQLVNTDTWPMKHQGTLLAFGYVQSSKQNRKFVTCPPNFSYSVVCEASRHIFIYQNASNENCQLRKRSGSMMKNVKVGQQHLFNIDKYGEVIGINATNEFLFILTEKTLIAIEIL